MWLVSLAFFVAAPLAEADVRAAVERWRAAQAAGDFAAYEALYAPAFRGVRRSGERTKTFDRAAWLADRKRMFAKPMRVDLTDLVVRVEGDGATAEFTQTWSSAGYADRGPKGLRFDRALKIVHEEMLASVRVADAAACRAALELKGEARVLAPDPKSPLHVCLVETREDRDGTHVLALLAPEGKKWKVAERFEFSFASYDGEEESESGSAAVEVVALGPAEKGVRLTRTTKKEGPQYADTRTTETLYRVRPGGLAKVFEVESESSTGEADRITERTLTIGDKATGGLYEIEVETTTKTVSYHGGENTEETETARYRWDGKAYLPAE
jgi:ketosteroid isomerase-like protein